MLQGRPLYDNRSDARFYFAASEAGLVRRAMKRGNNTLVYGRRGIGKTTLLRQLELGLREEGEETTFVDAAAIGDTPELVERIRDALKGRPGAFSGIRATAILGDPSPPPGGISRALHDALVGLADVEPRTILLDATASAAALHGLFGRMRDTLWQLPHRWLVAIDEDDRASVLRPPADTFFDTVVQLAPRSIEDLHEILRRRTDEIPDEFLARIATEARGNPRTAIRSANDAIVNDADPTDDLSTRARLLAAANAIGRPHGTLMAELLDLGQASPSDRALLKRLGLERARVNTLLKALEEKGLVESAAERSDGPGRPRTVYRPATKMPA